MNTGAQPIIKDVVLVGAGHAHVTVLRMFGMKPIPGVRFTLISREVHTPYSGMLPGLIAGLYSFDEAHIDTGPLARFAGARLYQDEVTGLDLDARRVTCRNRPPVPFDLLSLNIGSTPNTTDIPGASEHAIPVKPIDGFLARFEGLKERVLARRGNAKIALVGAGAGGVELLLSVEQRLKHELAAAALTDIRLVVLPDLRRRRHPADLSGRFSRTISSDPLGARHSRCQRRAGDKRRGRPDDPRRTRTHRCR